MLKKSAFLIAAVLAVSSAVPAEASATQARLSISAGTDTITIKAVSGSGNIIEHEPCTYEMGDSLRGKGVTSSGSTEGYLTEGQTLTLSRYRSDGGDRAYDKFYLKTDTGLSIPYYATSISHSRGLVRFAQDSIKGLFNEHTNDMTFAKDLGCSAITLNLDVSGLFATDYEKKAGKDVLTYQNQGRTYYFAKSAVRDMDERVSAASKLGMNVTGVLTPWKGTKNGVMVERVTDRWPSYMSYEENASSTAVPLTGINTSNSEGEHAFEALMEFMADRYSRSKEQGLIQTFVVSNEVDFTQYFCTGLGFDDYMEEYTRCLRIANTAVKKYCADMKVAIPFTHYWNGTGTNVGYGTATSFSPKKMLDWMSEHVSTEGDFDYAICPHLYSARSTSSTYALADSKSGQVTGDVETSKLLTFSNLEILDEYLRRPENMYNEKTVRWVFLNEGGVSSASETEQSLKEQAASLLQAYCKASQFSEIRQYNYYRLLDNEEFESGSGLNVGLLNADWSMKPAYYAYKYADTTQFYSLMNHYMPYISFRKSGKLLSYQKGISNVADLMAVTNSKTDWYKKYMPEKVLKKSAVSSLTEAQKRKYFRYSISDMTVSKIAAQIYTGKAIKPKITVSKGRSKACIKVRYKNNIKAGTATACISGVGRFTGTRTVKFRIVKKKAKTKAKTGAKAKTQAKTEEAKSKAKSARKGSLIDIILNFLSV